MAATDQSTIVLRRLIPATPEEVFAAWADPASMGAWMSPVGDADVTADVRVGGGLRVVMQGDGMEIEHVGEYREVDPPRRLSFTWRSEYTGGDDTLVTVDLSPAGDETDLVLTHELLTEEMAASHEGGWGGILTRLQGHLRPGG